MVISGCCIRIWVVARHCVVYLSCGATLCCVLETWRDAVLCIWVVARHCVVYLSRGVTLCCVFESWRDTVLCIWVVAWHCVVYLSRGATLCCVFESWRTLCCVFDLRRVTLLCIWVVARHCLCIWVVARHCVVYLISGATLCCVFELWRDTVLYIWLVARHCLQGYEVAWTVSSDGSPSKAVLLIADSVLFWREVWFLLILMFLYVFYLRNAQRETDVGEIYIMLIRCSSQYRVFSHTMRITEKLHGLDPH